MSTIKVMCLSLILCVSWAIQAVANDPAPPVDIKHAEADARILTAPPEKPDPSARYLFYLHGRIVQEKGRNAVSPRFGPYEYDKILETFATAGFTVISEVRPRASKAPAFASHIAQQIDGLLAAGVSGRQITVVGASAGGAITMLVSSRETDPKIGYVVMGSCNKNSAAFGSRLHGEMLSIYEAGDSVGTSCGPMFGQAKNLSSHDEIRLDTGLEHGFLFRPLPEWMGPVTQWARDRDA